VSQNYYVVNTGRGRGTHIMLSNSPHMPGVITQLIVGVPGKTTLCGLPATRYVNVFSPAEASCRECRKRWQLAPDPPATTMRRLDDRIKLARAQNVIAREWITANLPDVRLTDETSGAKMRQVIRRRYPGGWAQFNRDHLTEVTAQDSAS
jgi:hypothetical protein